MSHGLPSFLEDPIPDLVRNLDDDPYKNPNNPPENPDLIEGFCAMKVKLIIQSCSFKK